LEQFVEFNVLLKGISWKIDLMLDFLLYSVGSSLQLLSFNGNAEQLLKHVMPGATTGKLLQFSILLLFDVLLIWTGLELHWFFA
jgi:hypothetical protein